MKKIITSIIAAIMLTQILSICSMPLTAKNTEGSINIFNFKTNSHLLTKEEVEQLKIKVGVYDKNKNYNEKYGDLGTGLAPPSEDEWDELVGTINVVDSSSPSEPSASSADLSSDPCFPQVRSQGGQGSCAAWAATYYAAGYVQAKDNGWTRAETGNNDNLLSPAFTYNKVNHGYDSGSHTYTNGYIMQDIGVCTWSNMPYNQGDAVSWGNENAWRDAPQYRINDIYMVYARFDDADINIIKNAVENGYPVTFALNANSYYNFGSDDVLGLAAMAPGYNHANTIVGYDDSVTDVETGEVGAFKCVNSWGIGWGPAGNGYYWMTYNAFKGPQNTYPACWFTDLYTTTEPLLLSVWQLDPQPDRDASLELGVGSYSSPLETFSPYLNGHTTSSMHSYPAFMCLDISSFYNEWAAGANNFYLEFGNAAVNDGIITSFKVEYYQNNYVPGVPTRVSSESQDTPVATPGHANVYFPYNVGPNNPPYAPINPSPYDGELDVITNPTLNVTAEDPDGNYMDITFYDASDDSIIGIDNNVASGNIASIVWSDLSYETPYGWYAVASDGEFTNTSSIWSFTTGEPQPEKFYANQDITVQNGGITGSYMNTQNSDNSYMKIKERDSGGKPSNRYSYLEHKWTIQVTGGLQYYKFFLEAYHTLNSEGDHFVFAYSLNDVQYNDMVTVEKTNDDNMYQIYTLPTTLSGTVYIRVRDTDHTKGNRFFDTLSIDHMYIEGTTGTPPANREPLKPLDPSPYNTETNVDINPTLSVYVYDPDGDGMNVTFYNETGALLGTVLGVASGRRASIDLSGLLFETTYLWYAEATDLEYTNTSDTWSFTTRQDIPVGGMYVWDISWSTTGPHLSSIITIRVDSDGDGVAAASDDLVSGATVTYNLTHQDSGDYINYSGSTDSTGTVTFQWKKAPSGTYEGIVTDVEHSIYEYISELNVEQSDTYTL